MINKKNYIILFICSVLLGILVTFHFYVQVGFFVFLAASSFLLILIIVSGIFTKKSNWKNPLKLLSLCFVAFFAAYFSDYVKDKNWLKQHQNIIENIYKYKKENKVFPQTLETIKITNSRYNYIPDSSLNNFELYYKDRRGFPHKIDSRDKSATPK